MFCDNVDKMRGRLIGLAGRESAWVKEGATGFLEMWVKNVEAVTGQKAHRCSRPEVHDGEN